MEIYTLKLTCNTDSIFKEQSMCRINLKNLNSVSDKMDKKLVISNLKVNQ